ncbi:MAG: hypothetical protein B7Y39_06815 [Bdellovibrio sp. 28-41-41]|nr:MAG: hypothetical protein B7Y39_06815 [Bdellovibrio sp. 28-41-41]
MFTRIFLTLVFLLVQNFALGAAFDVQSSLFGYMRGTYGNGSRYGQLQGYDRIGLAQFAVGVAATVQDNYKFVGLFAADVLSDGKGDGASVGIKDTFVEIEKIGASDFGISVGAQPFLFGLKSNGYPGDHTIQPSIEYMKLFGPTSDPSAPTRDGRSFAVSQQAGPSAKLTYSLNKDQIFVLGVFDTSENAPAMNRGSAVHENIFFYYKGTNVATPDLLDEGRTLRNKLETAMGFLMSV